ncbi:MAG: deoxyribose-phosphate aldolase [Peptostreptococcales bacterium]
MFLLRIEKYFDHTLLKPEAKASDIKKLCQEAKDYGFYAVCVNSSYVGKAKEYLGDFDVKIASVIGFPLGASDTETKVFETRNAIKNGATEIDMVINIGYLKDRDIAYVQQDIHSVVRACGDKALLKVILETGLLSEEEIILACQVAKEAGADFVKTSTGFLGEGAKVEHIKLMRETVGENMQIKASGGIRDLKKALSLIEAGANRIGASATVSIMEEYKNRI